MTNRPSTGPGMLEVLRYLAEHPGATNQTVAIHAGPNGSHAYGDRLVKRCYARGLIEDANAGAEHWRRYAWQLTAAGRLELAADEVRTADIEELRDEAIERGDFGQARLCDRALAGAVDGPNWQDCARVIARRHLEDAMTERAKEQYAPALAALRDLEV
jgi:hypothetical protein